MALVELTPTFTVSSVFGTETGHTSTGAGMRDGLARLDASIWGSNGTGDGWIQVDLGSSKLIGKIELRCAATSSNSGWGPAYLNGSKIQYSSNGTTWTDYVASISGMTETSSVPDPQSWFPNIGARYWRIFKSATYCAVGDFRLWEYTGEALTGNAVTSAAGTLVPPAVILTGLAATSAAGQVKATFPRTPTGNAASGAAGTVTIGIVLAISGVSGTAGVGTVVPALPGSVTGSAITSSIGSLGVGISRDLTGPSAATGAVGSVAPGITLGLTGATGTGAAGTAGPATTFPLYIEGLLGMACLAKISPMDPATGLRTDLYISSVNDPLNGPLCNGLNNVMWEPAMLRAPSFTVNLWNGDFVTPADPGAASISINMEALKKTYSVDNFYWIGAPVEIYSEIAGVAWPWTTRFYGNISDFNREAQTLTLRAEVDKSVFKKNVLTATYAGTGSAEGSADIKNKLKPLIFGWAMNVEPVMLDAVNSVYQFSGYGAIEEVTKLYEKGSDFGASTGDYASYALLVAAAITPGRYATCLAEGLVRLGAPQAGLITGDIKGHKIGATTPRLSGAVITALATIAGVSSAIIESTTISAMDVAAPYNINMVLTDQTTWLEIAQKLALNVNWMPIIGLTGRFGVNAVSTSGTEVLTINAQGQALPLVKKSNEQDVSYPYFKTVMSANQAWRVHTFDEISFYAAIIDTGRYDNAKFYREGNIVDSADGSRWLYINAVPGSGNAPPTWPTTSNAYWSNMSPPIDGLNSAQIFLYQRAASAPSAPTGTFTYTFATGVLSGGTPGSWTQAIPTADGNPLYVIVASAIASTATDTIDGTEFSGPVIDSGAGLSVATVMLYQRAASTPSVPGSSLTYTFATGILSGTLGSWTQSIPSGGNPVYTTQATAVTTGTTDTITSGEWAAPVIMAQNGSNGSPGANGANGQRTAILHMYKWSSTTPSTFPSGTSTYTWASTTFTDPGTTNGWSQTIGTPGAGDKLWRVTQTFTDTNTSSTSSVTWSASSSEQYTPTLGDLAALNSVATAKIDTNAVTNLTSAFTGNTSVSATSTWTQVQTVTFTSTGAPNLINFSFMGGASGSPLVCSYQIRLKRSGTVIWTNQLALQATTDIQGAMALQLIDTPSSGSVTYSMEVINTIGGGTLEVNDCALSVLETKR